MLYVPSQLDTEVISQRLFITSSVAGTLHRQVLLEARALRGHALTNSLKSLNAAAMISSPPSGFPLWGAAPAHCERRDSWEELGEGRDVLSVQLWPFA